MLMMHKARAFTLIELLVVIAIIALLMGIMMPALRRARELAREVICKSHLQQWSLCMEMYTSAHDGRFMPGIDEDWATGRYSWIYTLIPYYKDIKIRLCPKAPRTVEQGGTMPWVAWDVSKTNPNDFSYLMEPLYKIGSYGINWWVNDSDLVSGGHDAKNKWRRTGQKNSGTIPVLMDCGFMLARPEPYDPAPANDGEFLWSFGGGMRRVCTNRHTGRVNILFMDWSIREVRLKELWRLKWHRAFVPTEPQWPEWIEKL
jgi:prepilin-type N-terminal cleavage/methylation domain-containing protein/prepilin-type processing-associated H-X9-DG protein